VRREIGEQALVRRAERLARRAPRRHDAEQLLLMPHGTHVIEAGDGEHVVARLNGLP
jgi:hypothetical protein